MFIKLFDNFKSELQEREDAINSFATQLRYVAKFDDRIKDKFFSKDNILVDNQTFTNKE